MLPFSGMLLKEAPKKYHSQVNLSGMVNGEMKARNKLILVMA